jgi:hypothetical protein
MKSKTKYNLAPIETASQPLHTVVADGTVLSQRFTECKTVAEDFKTVNDIQNGDTIKIETEIINPYRHQSSRSESAVITRALPGCAAPPFISCPEVDRARPAAETPTFAFQENIILVRIVDHDSKEIGSHPRSAGSPGGEIR